MIVSCLGTTRNVPRYVIVVVRNRRKIWKSEKTYRVVVRLRLPRMRTRKRMESYSTVQVMRQTDEAG